MQESKGKTHGGRLNKCSVQHRAGITRELEIHCSTIKLEKGSRDPPPSRRQSAGRQRPAQRWLRGVGPGGAEPAQTKPRGARARPRPCGPFRRHRRGARALPALGPAGSCRGRSQGPEDDAGGLRSCGAPRRQGRLLVRRRGRPNQAPRARGRGGSYRRHPTPLGGGAGAPELRPPGAAGSDTRVRPPCSSRGKEQARPGRHLLPARTGPSPALPSTTGRVSLCRCRRRRHFPVAAASLPETVRFLHSPGPGTASSSSLPPAPPTLRKRSTSPTPPAHTNGGRPTPATQARSENSALRSLRAPHPHAMKGAGRLAAKGGDLELITTARKKKGKIRTEERMRVSVHSSNQNVMSEVILRRPGLLHN
ncbi:GAS2-like protein 1 [Heliangelus exortis]|uniref:GAS2-like protein 1 n=1 Tax=Heliangelus exortis TaxID=472823 RepID=UPI003A8F9A18